MDNVLLDKLKQVEQEKIELQIELSKLKRGRERWACYLLLLLGLILSALAVIYSHNIAAFLGISLTFWGALLFYLRPTDLIRKEILESTVVEPLKNIHKMLDERDCHGTPRYILPENSQDLRDVTIYISNTESYRMPLDKQLTQKTTFLTSHPPVRVSPPGLGLAKLIEKTLKTDFSAVDLEYIQLILSQALVEGLEMAEEFQMSISDSIVQAEIRGTIFDEIINELEELETYRRLGDPLSSAIACILATSTQRPITIEGIKREPKEESLKITYRIEAPRARADYLIHDRSMDPILSRSDSDERNDFGGV